MWSPSTVVANGHGARSCPRSRELKGHRNRARSGARLSGSSATVAGDLKISGDRIGSDLYRHVPGIRGTYRLGAAGVVQNLHRELNGRRRDLHRLRSRYAGPAHVGCKGYGR